MLVIALVIGVICALYLYLSRNLGYWKERGVEYLKGYPIVGNFLGTSLKQRSIGDSVLDIYNSHPNNQVLGMFLFMSPTLMIRDPEVLKKITVKDFDHFTDHTELFFRKGFDSLFDKNLFSLQGRSWHEMRSTLSPAFTSSKMRVMFSMVTECGEQFAKHYKNEINKTTGGILHVELKELYTRFTTDVIATAAFGVKVDSFGNPTNDFYTIGRETMYFANWRLLLLNAVPNLMRILKINMLPGDCNYFRNLVNETIAVREKNNIVRPDMIHLLLQAKKGTLKSETNDEQDLSHMKSLVATEGSNELKSTSEKPKLLTDDDIAAQAFIFFLAGFDTVSTLMCFATYELAVNAEIQKRLYKEIVQALNSCNGKLTYDALNKMKYMDQVISESLRKWPPAVMSDRLCTKDYQLEANGQLIQLRKGTLVSIPIYGIHRDPKYYPNPELFDPERFNDDNKDKIQPFTYLPFGSGPRICIASRFALMEAKTAIFYMIQHFEVVVTKNTTIPARLTSKSNNMALENGFQLGLKIRS